MRPSIATLWPLLIVVVTTGVFGAAGPGRRAQPPYPPSPVIGGLELDWSTHRRDAQGSDNFQLTWADDDNLYGAWGDGGGFGGDNQRGRVDLGVARVAGSWRDYQGSNVWGGHEAARPATFDGKSWGMISLGNELFMWVVPDEPPGLSYRNHYATSTLAHSTDHAATWTLADWSFNQSQGLTIPTFLNFGRASTGVPRAWQGYVYTYFIRPENPAMEQEGPQGRGLTVHRPGALYLARATIEDFGRSPAEFQFFRGIDPGGGPTWGSIAVKRPVFEDPAGVGWCASACYHPGLKRVLLSTEHDSSSQSLIGIFDAPAPWGPWTTIAYHTQERPFGASRPGSSLPWRNNVFLVAFVPKWFEGDQFTLSFTGAGRGRDNDSFNTVRGRFARRAASGATSP